LLARPALVAALDVQLHLAQPLPVGIAEIDLEAELLLVGVLHLGRRRWRGRRRGRRGGHRRQRLGLGGPAEQKERGRQQAAHEDPPPPAFCRLPPSALCHLSYATNVHNPPPPTLEAIPGPPLGA